MVHMCVCVSVPCMVHVSVRKCVCVCICMYIHTDTLLLCDEATSALDTHSEAKVMQVVCMYGAYIFVCVFVCIYI